MCLYILLSTTYPPNTHRHTHNPLMVSPHRRESLQGRGEGGCWWKVAQAHGMWSGLHICRKDETSLPILQWWCQPAYMTVCGWGAKFLLFRFVFFFLFPSLALFHCLFCSLCFFFFFFQIPLLLFFFCHFSFCSQRSVVLCIIAVTHMGQY